MAPRQKDADESVTPSINLWVGNLAPDVTDSDLIELFGKYGVLDSVTAYSSRSFGFVYFQRVEDAIAAKEGLQGTVVRGNPLKIEFARPARPCKLLWVGGISPAISKEELEGEFLKFGKIQDFKFLREKNTAFVEYVKLDDASLAVKNMNGKRIGGDQIRVDFFRSQSSKREQVPDVHEARENQFLAAVAGVRLTQPLPPFVGQKEGQPSKVLWIGYPTTVQIDEQMLHNAMILFGEIENIKNFPTRHYAFVEFRSVDEARRAKEGLQGRLFNDRRITITYSNSELAPGKDYASLYPGIKGPRPEMFNEHPFGPGQIEVFDNRSMRINNFPAPLQPGSISRQNLPLRPLGPQGGSDPLLPGPEFNDFAMHNFADSKSHIPRDQNWGRPSTPGSGILPSPAHRIRPPVRSASTTGWDVVDPTQFQREPKRSRINGPSSVDDDSFTFRKIDDYGQGLDKIYGHGAPDLVVSSPGGARATMGRPLQGHIDNDYIWRGIIAKGGTPVCNARCVPIGKGIESDLPEIVNCSARTGLDMLTKHYAEAIGFDIVFFLPDSEDDFASYTEFLRYLASKDRAGVAKFDDGTTLFLVPPSDFLSKVLKVKGPERLYGVVLKLPQQIPSSASIQPQAKHFHQYIDKHQIPPPEADHNRSRREEEHVMPMDYNRVLHGDSKVPSKSVNPTSESVAMPSVPQGHMSNSSVAVSQAGISLTPELIATLTSLLPAKSQTSASESRQPALGSSTGRLPFVSVASDKGASLQGWKHDNQVSGNTNPLQLGNQFNSQLQVQHYPSVTHAPNHSANTVPGSTQLVDSSGNLTHQGALLSKPSTSFSMPSQTGQYASTPQFGQQYQLEVPHGTQKSYQMAHGIDIPVSHSPPVVQQPHNPIAVSSQVQQLQTPLSGGGQGTSEIDADKNQRYQSTLQFAANLLFQIQNSQPQQQANAPAQWSGNQQ